MSRYQVHRRVIFEVWDEQRSQVRTTIEARNLDDEPAAETEARTLVAYLNETNPRPLAAQES